MTTPNYYFKAYFKNTSQAYTYSSVEQVTERLKLTSEQVNELQATGHLITDTVSLRIQLRKDSTKTGDTSKALWMIADDGMYHCIQDVQQLASDNQVTVAHIAGIIGAFNLTGRVNTGPFRGVQYIGWTPPPPHKDRIITAIEVAAEKAVKKYARYKAVRERRQEVYDELVQRMVQVYGPEIQNNYVIDIPMLERDTVRNLSIMI